MRRGINCLLITAILVQTTGCAFRRQMIRPELDAVNGAGNQIQEEALQRLAAGMHARIILREDVPTPHKGRFIECTIESVELTSLTVIVKPDYFSGTAKERITLRYSDMSSIRFRVVEPWGVFYVVVATGTVTILLIMYAFSKFTWD